MGREVQVAGPRGAPGMRTGSVGSTGRGQERRGVLRIVPIYCGGRTCMIGPLGRVLAETFRVDVVERPPSFDPELAFDGARGQYNSRMLLAQLLRQGEDGGGAADADRMQKILAVTSVDLFIPVLTFVFGEAQLDGRAAVVSSHRLDDTLYGLPRNEDRLLERLEKEAVHELGHTYGLVHCTDGRCVMASSTYVEEIDLKSARFCDRCIAELRTAGRRAQPDRP